MAEVAKLCVLSSLVLMSGIAFIITIMMSISILNGGDKEHPIGWLDALLAAGIFCAGLLFMAMGMLLLGAFALSVDRIVG